MKKTLFKISSWLIVVLFFYFLLKIVLTNWYQISTYHFHFNLYYLLLSSIIYCLVFLLFSIIWQIILKKSGYQLGYREIFYISGLGRLGRYIPGGVWEYLIRLRLLSGKLPLKIFITSCILENALIITAGFLLALFLLVNDLFWNFWLILLIFFLIFTFFTFLLFPQLFYNLINYSLKILKKQPISADFYLNSKELFIIFFTAIIIWLIWGFSFFLFLAAFVRISFSEVFSIILIFCAALNFGRILIFVPAGLGASEGVLTFFLKRFFDLGIATLISLLTRVWLIINDLLFLIFALIVNIFQKKPYVRKNQK